MTGEISTFILLETTVSLHFWHWVAAACKQARLCNPGNLHMTIFDFWHGMSLKMSHGLLLALINNRQISGFNTLPVGNEAAIWNHLPLGNNRIAFQTCPWPQFCHRNRQTGLEEDALCRQTLNTGLPSKFWEWKTYLRFALNCTMT